MYQDLIQKISTLRGAINPILPDGCPFILGGGLIRDALYGGCPGDIDIWLPSNLTVRDIDLFIRYIRGQGFDTAQGWQGQAIFTGPGAREQQDLGLATIGTAPDGEYGDVSNHWVIELEHPRWPKINFMRSMTEWTGDAPSFFTSIMRNFDLDCCMFFVGLMPGQNGTNVLIAPEHLVNTLHVPPRNGTIQPILNEVYWNQMRLNNTSADRVQGRIAKMNRKYNFRIPTDPNQLQTIPTNQINAVPVRFSTILPAFNHSGWGRMATATSLNRMHPAQQQIAWDRAVAEYQSYAERMGVQYMIHHNLNVMSLVRRVNP